MILAAEIVTTVLTVVLVLLLPGGVYVCAALYFKAQGHRADEDDPIEHTHYIRTNMQTWRTLFGVTAILAGLAGITAVIRLAVLDANVDISLLATAIWIIFYLIAVIALSNYRSKYASLQVWEDKKDTLFRSRPF